MLDKLLDKAIENMERTGNHIQYEMSEISLKLTIDDIEKLADELGNRRMRRQVEHHRNGTHRRRSDAAHLNSIQQMVFGQLNSLNMRRNRK